VSPDGRWIAYQSAESGRSEVHVRAFPSLDQERQVSNGGGVQPLWSKDGRELYYLTLNSRLMTVEVKSGATLETGNPRSLFQTPIEGNPLLAQYAVSADGQRFLMMENSQEGAGAAGTEQFHVELNWFAPMNARVR
jgi:eukaryotic-like serine/threonine-protein kinase